MKPVDLHIHTNMSDGNISSEEIIKIVSGKLSAIAFTNHESIKAYENVTVELGKKYNV
ncbi:MAG: hypothetical protein K0B02_05075 [DPANN group archaeon]|nr:hypothetical protein [DPANN group archaeon]